jgi:hypothetical protein
MVTVPTSWGDLEDSGTHYLKKKTKPKFLVHMESALWRGPRQINKQGFMMPDADTSSGGKNKQASGCYLTVVVRGGLRRG